MNPLTQSKKTTIRPLLIPLLLVCFALLPRAQGVLPAPDGGYPGGNTAEGTNALFSRTSGVFNTAIGLNALLKDTTGSRNTANGANALRFNTTGISNTAIGTNALFLNSASNNTAIGADALFSNTGGTTNTALGAQALLNNFTGNNNIALGNEAGKELTTGDNNIDIGNIGVFLEANTIRIGTVGTQTATFIAGIFNQMSVGGATVLINSSGKLGTNVSSARFKQNIQDMGDSSQALMALRPVTFHYKQELDPDGTAQFGLVAEEVEKVNPALVVRDDDGKPYTVRYDAVNAMLLNEFLKEHGKVKKLEAAVAQQRKDFQSAIVQQQKDFEVTTAQQQKEIQSLTASLTEQAVQIQKVSAQLEVDKTAPQIVLNNQQN